MKKWIIIYSDDFIKDFAKLDRPIQLMVRAWIQKHLIEIDDPRLFGKPLAGNLKGLWRYRIGDYRLLVEISNGVLTILFISIGHRKDIYK